MCHCCIGMVNFYFWDALLLQQEEMMRLEGTVEPSSQYVSVMTS